MRERLILAAIERFGKRGFDGVGTREIAAAVGTPMSSITYHFGGKEGLYLAAAEHIFDYLVEVLSADRLEMPGAGAPRDEHLSALCKVIRSAGAFMLSEQSAPFALFIGREQQDPSPKVRDLMQAKLMPLIEVLVGEVSLLRPECDPPRARAITVFLFGMAITLRHSRASLGLLLGTATFDAATRAMLLDELETSVRAVLAGGGE